MKGALRSRALVLSWFLIACDVANPQQAPSETGAEQAMRSPLEVQDASQNAFSTPLAGLDASERARFFVGNSYFNQNWVSAPSSVTSRDGLGPRFNARSCSGCHFKDGRGRATQPGEPLRTALVRISVPARSEGGAPEPDPHYGDQLQGDAVAGVEREADVFVRYREQRGRFADGQPYSLRVPALKIEARAHGPLAEGVLTSLRTAPALLGMGLLEAVPERVLLARADPDDRDGNGISGRANRVPSAVSKQLELGRFGWKAEQASVLDQTAAAFVGDMGITSRLFARENDQPRPGACCGESSGSAAPELDDAVLDSVVSYVRTLALPARRHRERPAVERGELLFATAGCAGCHTPTLTTADDALPHELAARTIHPYSDLLLHDLGPALSDERPSFGAEGREWRTAPLWGVGLVERVSGGSGFLHDGRARDLAEAVLWHGGEAEAAKRRFLRMRASDRVALLAFLESL